MFCNYIHIGTKDYYFIMLNVHFNGEIIRCPDASGNYMKLVQARELSKICQFGVKEETCKTFQGWQMLNPARNMNRGCCMLDVDPVIKETPNTESKYLKTVKWSHYICPKAQKRYLASISPKKFKIDNIAYRKMSSAAHWMVKESTSKTIFLTLTFPKFKKDEITEKQANECFSKFAENIKKTYGCTDYIAVRERGEENNRLHFHILCAIPFIHFSKLNNAWCNAISDYCEFSNCALQSRRGHRVIKNPVRAIRYVCKYIAKCKGLKSDTRLYFISNNTIRKPFVINGRPFNISDVLKNYKSVQVKEFDYVTRFRITDLKEFNHFCVTFLYALFECSILPSGLYFDTGNMTET